MLSQLSVNVTRKLLLSTNIKCQKIVKYKLSHLARCMRNISPKNNYVFNTDRHSKIIGTFHVRYQSTVYTPTTDQNVLNKSKDSSAPEIQTAVNDTVQERVSIFDIPDMPSIPQKTEILETIIKFHPNGEPTLASIGLGGYSPLGLIQSSLEWLHIYCDLPWWSTIMIGTLCVRLLIFPLVILSQKSSAHLANNAPGLQKIQKQMSDARKHGNEYEAALYGYELSRYIKEKKLYPLQSFAVAFAQIPIFILFYMALSRMANAPVESLRTGGLWWFTDLTIPDPFYILPVFTAFIMFVTIESAITTGSMRFQKSIKNVFRVVPIIMLPFLIKFPGAILCYWMSTNMISLVQSGIFRIPAVRKCFNIPVLIKHEPQVPKSKTKFGASISETWNNYKISMQLENKKRADAIAFNAAAKGPLPKTYEYDPTQKPPTVASNLAKTK